MIPKARWIVESLVILLFFCAVAIWADMRMNCLRDWPNRAKRRKYSKEKHRPEYRLWYGVTKIIIPISLILSICSIGAYARFNVAADKYIYLKNELETQHSVNELFNEESIEKNEEKQEEENQANSLYIPKKFIDAPITDEMVDYFEEILSSVYVNGSLKSYDIPPTIAQSGARYEHSKSGSIKEAVKFRDQYNNSPNQASLYQYGRSMSEYQPSNEDPFETVFEVVSESFNSLKAFLQYQNRNVNNSINPVVIDAYWVAFLEGKLFLRIGKFLAGDEKGAAFSNCLLVEAFVSFQIALDILDSMDTSNTDYAKIAYYVGNAGETLLGRINRDEETLYNKIGFIALQGYEKARACYLTAPDYYEKESGIENHISAGIETLNELGFTE